MIWYWHTFELARCRWALITFKSNIWTDFRFLRWFEALRNKRVIELTRWRDFIVIQINHMSYKSYVTSFQNWRSPLWDYIPEILEVSIKWLSEKIDVFSLTFSFKSNYFNLDSEGCFCAKTRKRVSSRSRENRPKNFKRNEISNFFTLVSTRDYTISLLVIFDLYVFFVWCIFRIVIKCL